MAFDLASRQPCFDEMCVGIIGKNGRCGTCGKSAPAGWTAPAAGDAAAVTDDDSDASVEPSSGEAADEAVAASPGAEASTDNPDGFDPGRRLCPDGACIGVIGPDGHCKICHLPG